MRHTASPFESKSELTGIPLIMPSGNTSARLILPIAGVLVAIAATTTMDATGLFMFSALPLFPLLLLFWYIQRFSRQSIGFVWGQWRHYGLAILYPVVVLGALGLISAIMKTVDISQTNWRKALLNFGLVSISTMLVGLVTEEGFFRGWLWASLKRAGEKQGAILICSSIAFALWHISSVTFDTGYKPSLMQVPVFIINAAVIGAIWGLLRWVSGSIVVTSVSHALWNGGAYVLFGFGTKTGALGVKNTAVYGPEIGVLGLVANVIFAIVLYGLVKRMCLTGTQKHA